MNKEDFALGDRFAYTVGVLLILYVLISIGWVLWQVAQ